MNAESFEQFVFGLHSSWGINGLQIPDNLKDCFSTWFKKNGILFKNGNSITENEYKSKSHFIEGGRCYNNSQRVNNDDNTFKYFEGFYHIYLTPPVIRHAFNVKDEVIKDFSAKCINTNTSYYFGVNVPEDVIEICLTKIIENPKRIINEMHNISLIRPYFFYSIGRMDLFSIDGYYAAENNI